VAEGMTDLRAMRGQQPWPTGEYAASLLRGNADAAA
jgi:hypothetical protein